MNGSFVTNVRTTEGPMTRESFRLGLTSVNIIQSTLFLMFVE